MCTVSDLIIYKKLILAHFDNANSVQYLLNFDIILISIFVSSESKVKFRLELWVFV